MPLGQAPPPPAGRTAAPALILPFEHDGGLTLDELRALDAASAPLVDAIRRAQKLPATLDRDAIALLVNKLEEAEFWLHATMQRTLKNRAERSALREDDGGPRGPGYDPK